MTCCKNCGDCDGDDDGDVDDYVGPWHWRGPAGPRARPCRRSAGEDEPAGGAAWPWSDARNLGEGRR